MKDTKVVISLDGALYDLNPFVSYATLDRDPLKCFYHKYHTSHKWLLRNRVFVAMHDSYYFVLPL
jgi:hypothetical protein